MENKINDSCDGRGCIIVNLPYDIRVKPVYMEMFSKRYDFSKILSISNLLVDEMVEKERPLEKKAA